jgi:hypothetical protein
MDLKGNADEEAGDDVSCAAKASGVALAVWAKTEPKAPQASVSIAMAQKELKACFTESSETKTQILQIRCPWEPGRPFMPGEKC